MADPVCHTRHTFGFADLIVWEREPGENRAGCFNCSLLAYALFGKSAVHLQEDSKWWLFICGFLSGVLGGAYGLNGPPLAVYGNLRKWTAKHFRATLQAYFLPASLIGFIGYYLKGLVTAEVSHYFLASLSTTIPAIFLGRYLNHILNDQSFFKYVYGGLVTVGLVLIIHSIFPVLFNT